VDVLARFDPDQGGDLIPGTVVDNCRLEALLGSGAFGAVYRAHHIALDQPRAFKFLMPRSGVRPEHKRRFLTEARHTAKLGHPNIVIVHNVGEFRGLPFIHMECLTGASLRARLRPGRPPLEEALRLIDQVLAALAAAHEKGVVHRDVKPENVMVLDGGAVKVVDFGLSVNIEAQTSRLTVGSDQVLGTPLYMAPEQWQTSRVGPPADVWSAGVMLYEMLAGQHPFGGQNILQLMYGVLHLPHPPLREVAPPVPEAVSAVVDRMLAKAAADRFADAAEARRALRKVAPRQPPEWFGSLVVAAPVANSVVLPESVVALPAGPDNVLRFARPRDGGNMVLLPGGEFHMGSNAGDPDERPQHVVRLSPFLLDEAPVTRRQFANFLSLWGSDRDDAGHRLLDPEVACLERVGMCWEPADETEPVSGVTWHGAMAYARWAGMQLPSEAQLEYAFGQGIDRPPNLLGTVRHWCADTYDERFYARSPALDPVNTATGAFVAIRGRSRLAASDWSPSQRNFAAPHEMFLDVGFRCACTSGGIPASRSS
jgi:serine/threonine protein kinase